MNPHIPELFLSFPPIIDPLITSSSAIQRHTVEAILPYLAGAADNVAVNEHGVPRLDRERHIRFLHKQLGALPAGYVAADSTRPWIFYWCLAGLSLLGEDVSSYRTRLIDTALSIQNPGGGFGGGFGQDSHICTTYAIVLALAIVGGEEAYRVIDRRAMWRWMCSLKQPDGGFQVALGGEVDIRGAYCAAVVITLLNLPLDLSTDSPAWTPERPTLLTGLADYVRRCQTYEGGISERPDAEAHGAYAFCGLGCLALLDAPHRIIPEYLDVPRFLAWLSSRQNGPEGGFCGRTNKLVDSCYSLWVGGCWPLMEATLRGQPDEDEARPAGTTNGASLFHREGLTRYILCCCQDRGKRGGLRDKPGKPSDAYHTCYALHGLSLSQHVWQFDGFDAASEPIWKPGAYTDNDQVFDEIDRVIPMHPIYNIPLPAADDMKQYFSHRQGF